MNYRRSVIMTLAFLYAIYILMTSWGTGKLAKQTVDEVLKIQCKPECSMYRRFKTLPVKKCRVVCGVKENKNE